jgi:hypothetical protein
MTELLTEILNVLKKFEPLLVLVIPGVIIGYMRIKKQVTENFSLAKKLALAKTIEQYTVWKHDESRRVILHLRELCNKYKDTTGADQVAFLQFTNGTVALSGLSNMFVTCEAEDTRYGKLPNLLERCQRLPYILLADWINYIIENREPLPLVELQGTEWKTLPTSMEVESQIATVIKDRDSIPVGVALFNYACPDFCESMAANELQSMVKFQTSIESVLLGFYVSCEEMKYRLHIGGEVV